MWHASYTVGPHVYHRTWFPCAGLKGSSVPVSELFTMRPLKSPRSGAGADQGGCLLPGTEAAGQSWISPKKPWHGHPTRESPLGTVAGAGGGLHHREDGVE